ncbi:MAG: MATE family efflux transporter [Hyphomicrobiales bacterium]|nr:MATE family efflux transporter [Hyphomicrobiales bacterium]
MRDPNQPNPLVSGPILPTLMRLALPNMGAMVATSLVAIAETSYVGLLGTSALAGLALVFPIVMLQQMMSGGAMGGGVSSSIARALGAGDIPKANALAAHAAIIGLTAGLAFALVVFFLGPALFAALGGRGQALEQGLAYAYVYAFAIVGVWMTNTLASIVRGSGNMRIPSATVFIAAIMQIVVGGALGLGLGPFPRLGMGGVACGQVAAYTAATLFFLWALTSGRIRVRLSLRRFSPDGALFRDILRVGGLACISPLQSVGTVLILTRLVSYFGTAALAGYGIGSRLEFLLIPIAFAVGVACVPMVGMAIGAGDVPRARRVAWTGGLAAAAMLGAVGLFFAVFPELWSRMFTHDPAVLESARVYLVWSGLAYSFYGLGLCLYFASQGAGKVLGPVLAGTVRLVVVIAGGLWLAAQHAPQWSMFVVVALSMAAYGLSTAGFIWMTPWGKK